MGKLPREENQVSTTELVDHLKDWMVGAIVAITRNRKASCLVVVYEHIVELLACQSQHDRTDWVLLLRIRANPADIVEDHEFEFVRKFGKPIRFVRVCKLSEAES